MYKQLLIVYCAAILFATVASEVYFEETFSDGDAWKKRWVQSKNRDDYGEFKLGAGKIFGNETAQKGLVTSQDARFYAISSKFKKVWDSNKESDLIILFTVKHDQDLDCGGGYIKILPSYVNPEEFKGESDYLIMFGPDICGPDRKVHLILNYAKKQKNFQIKKDMKPPTDKATHLYKLIIRPDQTYAVFIDDGEVASGSLLEDWDFLPPKKIDDPNVSKPSDWEDEEEIDDPNDVKPDDFDSIPEYIADPDAEKPDDWDDEMDGDWQAPEIKNPAFRVWAPRRIKNPNYKGPWVQPQIDNPKYEEDKEIYVKQNMGLLGLDLWQVKTGSVFDNFLVTDDEEYAEQFVNKYFDRYREAERRTLARLEEEQKKIQEEENRKREAEMKKSQAQEEDFDEDERDEL